MTRTERLFRIIQILRRHRRPVIGSDLARELDVSLRTLYRDMSELIAQGVPVRGEAGSGYVIDRSFDMPPLMLTEDELEAAALGARWVARQGDPALERAAYDLLAKIRESVPPRLRPVLLESQLEPFSFRTREPDAFDVADVRIAIRQRRKLAFDYVDGDAQPSRRTVWPFLVAYFDTTRIVCAWCELRSDFRHFRTDRMTAVRRLEERFPERTAELRRRWEQREETQRTSVDARATCPAAKQAKVDTGFAA